MSGKYNWVIDNTAIRVAMNVTGFALWLGLVIGLMMAI